MTKTIEQLSRRAFGRSCGVLVAACATAIAQQTASSEPPPRAKGPLVWLDMDQQALDNAYDQSVYAPNFAQITGRWATSSDAMRRRLGSPRRFAYGSTPAESLDVYVARRRNAPIHVFIHGGGWRSGAARDFAFPAELVVRSGAHFVVPDFMSVQDSAGDIMPLVDQVRNAIAWIHRNAVKFDGDPNQLYISGHSSGAHLAAVALVTDWTKEYDLPSDLVKGGLCCSGMFDLHPVRLSSRRTYLKINDEREIALSPQRHVNDLRCPVIVVDGTLETPEFQRQARDFAAAAINAGKRAELLVAEGYNHFEIIETLANPFGVLGRALLEQMKLEPLCSHRKANCL